MLVRTAGWRWPLLMAFIRWPLLMLASAMVILIYRWSGIEVGLYAGAVWATLTVSLVNLLCLLLLLWRGRVERLRLRDLMGFRRDRLWRDLGAGVAISLLLFAFMLGGVLATFFLMQVVSGPLPFEQVYLGDADFSLALPWWLAVVSAIVFPVLNAPVEELQYRGYAQPRLIARSGSVWLGIGVTAVGFGLQHTAFAFTLAAMPLFVIGYFAWGLGAGWIAQRQQRLAPLIIAHFISNLSFGVVPLFFVLQGG
jgi:uncharacterized protein